VATTIGRAAAPEAAPAASGARGRGVIGWRRRRRADRAPDGAVWGAGVAPAGVDVRAEVRHDALAALLGIEGAARALAHHRDLLSPAQADELAGALVGEVHRLAALLRDGPAADEPFDLRAAVLPVVACARADGLDVRGNLPTGVGVAGSREQVGRAVLSLLDNARRHAPGAPVEVWAEVGRDHVTLRVDDRGPGVPHELRASLFERGACAGPGAGSGLGLHVARRLVAAAGGTLRHEPRRGGGSSFVLRLPRAGPVS
jgi:signal transduction histidine kinase